jgi:exodeoxyribonuclease V gamma subunit
MVVVLHVHRAERADGLVEGLREVLAAPPADPFAPELISVPTRGMERWLTQRLSARLGASAGRADGICANVGFPFPRSLADAAVAAASGIDADTDPWPPERSVWPLLEVVDAGLGEPWMASLAAHLGGGPPAPDPARRARRFATVRHLAGLFDRYALHRPEMVRAWARGEDAGGAGRPLGAEFAWQAELWRRLRARIGVPDPAERVAGACGRLREDPASSRCRAAVAVRAHPAARRPARGPGRDRRAPRRAPVPAPPVPALWERVAAHTAGAPAVTRRAEDPTAGLPAHRLLASWGRDVRELQLVVGPHEHADHHHPVPSGTDTLLGRIQADVRADAPPPGAPLPGHGDARHLLAAGDQSLQIHACHGRSRQVEVVRDRSCTCSPTTRRSSPAT